MYRLYYLLAVLLLDGGTRPVTAAISFVETTGESGISHQGESWGAAWRDFDRDGLVDLWTTNHGAMPMLWKNVDGRRFADANDVLRDRNGGDTHGAAWADMDNDGAPDLLELTGGAVGTEETDAGSNNLLHNKGGLLQNVARERGLSLPAGRGRTPVWLDFDNDGDLDVLVMNQSRQDGKGPSTLFENRNGTFTPSAHTADLAIEDTASDTFAMLAEMTGEPPMELLIFGSQRPAYSPRVFRVADSRFSEIGKDLLGRPVTHVSDAVAADLDGDLSTDLFLTRFRYSATILPLDANSYAAGLFNNGGKTVGLDIHTPGDLSLTIGLPSIKWDFSSIVLGHEQASTPFTQRGPLLAQLELNAHDPSVQGAPAIGNLRERKIYVWYEPTARVWHIRFNSKAWAFLILNMVGDAAIAHVKPFGFQPKAPLEPVLLRRSDNGFAQGALPDLQSCTSVTSADFDNDMDLDLYLVCTTPIRNLPNVVLENLGGGHFSKAVSHGAEGMAAGLGDRVVAADYDNDGFVDVFVTNGYGFYNPDNLGSDQLFRNQGNTNNWLKIRLEGTLSNRDGIGAQAVVTAGGKRQLRLQNGSVHNGAQDDVTLHFGLGKNEFAEQITVRWPSGVIQSITNIRANQTLHVKEPSPSTDA